MLEKIEERFKILLKDGQGFVNSLSDDYWLLEPLLTNCYKWLSGSGNLIGIVTGNRGVYWEQASKVLSGPDLSRGIPADSVRRMHGILESTYRDWRDGLLKEIEYVVAATTFDDFLDHAADFHKANKKIESAVLTSVVLEDTVKKVARKHNIDTARSIEPIIDDLVNQEILNSVRGKRIKGYAGLRNKALHAQWDDFDIRDVGETIQGVRSLIEEYL